MDQRADSVAALQAALDAGGELDMEQMRLLIMRAAGTSEPQPEPDSTTQVPALLPSESAAEGEEVLQITLAGHTVRMQVRSVMGLSVWAASSAAAERAVVLLETQRAQAHWQSSAAIAPPMALELGAGGALPSLLARIAGFQMLATDGDAQVMQLIRRNFALNGFGFADAPSVQPRRLEWSTTGDLDEVCDEWPVRFSIPLSSSQCLRRRLL
jgi:hypothetical protein